MNRGTMMHMDLSVSALLRHAARHASQVEVVSASSQGVRRHTWQLLEQRSRQLVRLLANLGVAGNERIATLAWNGSRHLELYYAIAGSGNICHTVNPRAAAGQVEWMLQQAGDTAVFFDLDFLGLVDSLRARLPGVRHFVALCDASEAGGLPPWAACYESLLATCLPVLTWPQVDENTACGLCFTSGTTGHPKGVLYTQRSTVLHAMATMTPDSMGVSSADVVLPVVPMFHVNAWGLPYSSALAGAGLVLPGAKLDGESLVNLLEQEHVTFSAGVPTVWLGVLEHLRASGRRLPDLQRILIGGAAVPASLMEAFESEFGVQVLHGWGMTELSPSGTVSRLRHRHRALPKAQQDRLRLKQGPVIPGIDMDLIDDAGRACPWDGHTSGHLVVRGPWVVARYDGEERSPLVTTPDGVEWFPTGDIATIDAEGFMQITDRSKDVIKSGGEWISSVEIEGIAMAHPAVALAACIGVAHPKWDERPLLAVVRKDGTGLTRQQMLAHFEGRLPRWQVPDDVVFLTELPLGATGKIQKSVLRQQLASHAMPVTP